jgi:ABC-type multidrug transport system ATPase subunit
MKSPLSQRRFFIWVGTQLLMERNEDVALPECKREGVLAIATVLSMNPQILVLDEPSAGLDSRARRTLINLLRELPITMLVSTHDMRLVEELFPRTIVMDEGLIVADGNTKEILRDEKFLNEHGLEKP